MATNVSAAATPTPRQDSRSGHRHSKSANPASIPGSASSPAQTVRGANGRARKQNHNLTQKPVETDASLPQHNRSTPSREQNTSRPTTLDGSISSESPVGQRKSRQKARPQNGYGTPTSLPVMDGAAPISSGTERSPQRITSSTSGPQATPVKPAYAGPTFHASPAPSALPIPKFYSKSLPQPTAPQGLQARLDVEPEKVAVASPSPPTEAVELPAATASPLDIFFKADREERAKKKDRGAMSSSQGYFESLAELSGPQESQSAGLETPTGRHHARNASHSSGRELFMMELDGAAVESPRHNMRTPSRTSPPEEMPFQRAELPGRPAGSTSDRPPGESPSQSLLRSLVFSSISQQTPGKTPNNTQQFTPEKSASCSVLPSTRPSLSQRSSSGPSTPAQQSQISADTALLYGNRNLSPLFKAARSDSAKRTSSLRQEVTTSPSSPTPGSSAGIRNLTPPTPNRRSISDIDAATISRNYLNSHIQAAGIVPDVASLASRSIKSTASTASRSGELPKDVLSRPSASVLKHTSETAVIEANANFALASNGSTSQQRSTSVDTNPKGAGNDNTTLNLKSMEDDLRRMLKLNVLNGSTTRVQ